jgi:hypothetical protein
MPTTPTLSWRTLRCDREHKHGLDPRVGKIQPARPMTRLRVNLTDTHIQARPVQNPDPPDRLRAQRADSMRCTSSLGGSNG